MNRREKVPRKSINEIDIIRLNKLGYDKDELYADVRPDSRLLRGFLKQGYYAAAEHSCRRFVRDIEA